MVPKAKPGVPVLRSKGSGLVVAASVHSKPKVQNYCLVKKGIAGIEMSSAAAGPKWATF